MNTKMLFLILSLSGVQAIAAATFLERFKENPRSAIDLIPEKSGAILSDEKIKNKIDACRREVSREAVIKSARRAAHSFSVPEAMGSNDARRFLETTNVVDKIAGLDKMRTGEVSVEPWSGDYWAIRNGAAARRYLDANFPGVNRAGTWAESHNYFLTNPPQKVDHALYSPAEKYDLLVSDKAFTLTQASWSEGKRYNDQFGDVEKWMGLCHGWAPASFMEPRPTRVVNVKAFAGEESIAFYPDDLKALATLKWANGITVTNNNNEIATRFVGGRCDTKTPSKDAETGRLIDSNCFDLNPATWHIIMTNQVGQDKRPFVIDAAFDYEVWNQPVVSYSFEYFNPINLKPVKNLNEAIVKFGDPEFKDTFAKFRKNSKAVSVVGIVMRVTYVVETTPSNNTDDSPADDQKQSAKYYYDLELDAQGKIIGGEWYQNKHPDFVWMPVKNSMALNEEDRLVGSDKDAISVAPEASLSMAPLRYVMDKLWQGFEQ